MLDRLKQLFSGSAPTAHQPEQPHFDEADPRIAVAALLVHLIAVDGVVDETERLRLRSLLVERFSLQADDTEALIKLAGQREDEAVDLYSFTSSIKAHFDFDQRREVVEMLWELVYADGDVHEFEDNVVWRVAELLGISTRERVIIRKKVEQKLAR